MTYLSENLGLHKNPLLARAREKGKEEYKRLSYICRHSRLSILVTPTTPTPTPTQHHQQIGARGVIFVGAAGVVPVMFLRRLH